MNIKLVFAIVTITLALIFYTIGIFSVRKSHLLKKQHVIIFWMGLICDTTGTIIMTTIAKESQSSINTINLHGITGTIAILLMLFHTIWGTAVLIKNDARKQKIFHKFSIFVWMIWLVPYIIGMVMGMSN